MRSDFLARKRNGNGWGNGQGKAQHVSPARFKCMQVYARRFFEAQRLAIHKMTTVNNERW
jgi:hypothetical protein